MDTNSIPAILLLLLPGFAALQVFNLTSRKRTISDFEILLWSLLAAFVLLAPTALAWHRLDSDIPSLGDLVRNPQALPLRLAVFLYVVAVPFGWIVAKLDQAELVEQLAFRVGLDLRRRADAWTLAFREHYYLVVYLKGGDLLYGWPEVFSSDRSGKATELYLTNVWVWDREASNWKRQDDVRGVLLDASSIERIEFTREP